MLVQLPHSVLFCANISLRPETTREWTKSYFVGIATHYVHVYGSTTATDTATQVRTLLNAQFAPSYMMKGNSRLGTPSGENWFKTERVEIVACGPVALQGDDVLGAESRSEEAEL